MDISYIPFTFPGLPSVGCAFQTRPGGNISFAVGDDPAAVRCNRQALLRELGLDAFVELKQVHGDTLLFEPPTTPLEDDATLEADAHATSRPGVALMIKTADCQPILLAHTSGKYVAAIHAGWRGNRMGLPTTAVTRFCEHYGLSPRDVLAVRGPSLGPASAEFVNFAREWGQDYAPWFTPGTSTMDLWSLTRHQLREAGLIDAHIFGLDLCTASMPDMFFSYRQDKNCGRQASLVWIRQGDEAHLAPYPQVF